MAFDRLHTIVSTLSRNFDFFSDVDFGYTFKLLCFDYYFTVYWFMTIYF